LHYDQQSGAWRPEAFAPKKYVFRRLNADDRNKQKGKWWGLFEYHPEANWAFFEFGKDNPMPLTTCFEDTNATSWMPFVCKPVVHDGAFDKDTRRFELIHHGGYIGQGFLGAAKQRRP
jgi:hypothetical protein